MTIQEVCKIVQQWQNEGKKIVLTTGTFDLMHPGHTDFFEIIKKHGDKVVVGVNCDTFTRNRKGPGRPIIDENNRAKQVGSNRNVDIVFVA